MTAYATLRSRLEEVIEETLSVMNAEVRAGRITSDAATDKVQHLINLVRKFAASADYQGSSSDHETAPSSAAVEVLNLIQLPAPPPSPEVMTVETNPQLGFVRLSFGLVNLHQVALLDVAAKQLYLVGGVMRSLDRDDTVKLVHWTKLYQLR